jgi:Recombination endonuclease VII
MTDTPYHLRTLTRNEAKALTPDQKRERRLHLKCADARRFRVTHPKRQRTRALTTRYGISSDFYDWAVTKQDHVCGICGEPEASTHSPSGKVKALAVDHDHATHIVRGFLCTNCNPGLGYFKDNPALLRKAADYLEAHNTHVRLTPFISKQLAIPTN